MLLPRPEPHANARPPMPPPYILHVPLKNEDLQPLVIRAPKRAGRIAFMESSATSSGVVLKWKPDAGEIPSLAVDVDLGGKDAADGEERFDGGARRRVINSLVDAFGDAGERAASRQACRQGR